jgi:hypothetical protein
MILRTENIREELIDCVADFEWNIKQGGMRSCRGQWDIEGTDQPLTLYANRGGTFIVEPGSKPVPAKRWLEEA